MDGLVQQRHEPIYLRPVLGGLSGRLLEAHVSQVLQEHGAKGPVREQHVLDTENLKTEVKRREEKGRDIPASSSSSSSSRRVE